MTKGRGEQPALDRRACLLGFASTAGVLLAGCTSGGEKRGHSHGVETSAIGEAEVTPGEDLMQEHGLLERVLLVYEAAADRIERAQDLDLAVVSGGARIVRRFVEDYHEKLEEQVVFPRLEAARTEVALVSLLRLQHQRGREVTAEVLRLAKSGRPSPTLAQALRSFIRMYRPHAAREDTVLFPAFRRVVGGEEYRELGEHFEEQEERHLGVQGFERTVAEVARLETTLEIGDLSLFTPT